LRFPEFTEEWNREKIVSILTIGSGKDYKHLSKGTIPVFGTGGYMASVDDFLYEGESVCIGRKGTINKPLYFNGKFWTVDTLFYTHSFKNVLPKFVYNIFEQINWLKYNEASGVPSLSKSTIEQIDINIPCVEEQQKIATFLSLIDERIQTQNKIIEQLETLIKGLCQNLANNKQWEKQYLRNILTERKETNKDNLPIFSVSVSKGVINQIEYLGRSFASKNTTNYNVVHFGDVVYTKSPTGEFPYGIIKQSFISENVAVSPLYGVYEPKNVYIGSILHYYFNSPINANNYLHSLVQKGAKNTINITNQRFLDNTIFLPTDEKEVENIASLLNNIDQKIQTEEAILTQFENQKKYLLNQMFV